VELCKNQNKLFILLYTKHECIRKNWAVVPRGIVVLEMGVRLQVCVCFGGPSGRSWSWSVSGGAGGRENENETYDVLVSVFVETVTFSSCEGVCAATWGAGEASVVEESACGEEGEPFALARQWL